MRKIILTIVLVVAVAAIILAVTRPEPTPSERLTDAVTEASEAIGDTVGDMSSAIEAMARDFTNGTSEALEEFAGLLQSWRETGIVSDEGVDFGAAEAEIRGSDMDDASKEQALELLELLRTAPEEAKAQLQKFEEGLK